MRIIPASRQTRMPWKNGGGETAEVAVHPPGAGLAAFGWRVSVARQEGDATFSLFEGVDRTLAILDGAGLVLDVEGGGTHRLTSASPPCTFPADAATRGRLIAGPVSNFNVMSRRGAYAHRVERREVAGPVALAARWTLLLAGAPLRVDGEGGGAALLAGDAVLIEGGAGMLRIAGGPVLVASIDPV